MNSKGKKRVNELSKNEISKGKSLRKDTDVSINDYYFKSEFVAEFAKAWSERKGFDFDRGARFYAEPFPCCVLPNFLNSDQFVQNLKHDLNELHMHSKDSDLFQFRQSNDLASSSSPMIKKFGKLLYEDCLPWMKELTKLPLTSVIDMTCSMYDYTDVLLCHDDMLKERCIAFIYYLVPDWEEDDGGALDLFHSKEGNAIDIARSIIPVSNSFVFFEVSPASFHQVSEVLKDKTRLSINGWYHGCFHKDRNILIEPEQNVLVPYSCDDDEDIMSWVNPIYFRPESVLKIRQSFEGNSEIELQDFLMEEKYSSVAKALSDSNVEWEIVGPRNRKRVEEIKTFPSIVKKCMRVLHSEQMCMMLSNLTGLALHPLAEIESSSDNESNSESEASSSTVTSRNLNDRKESKMRCPQMATYCTNVRKWSHGCYTLLHDNLFNGKAKLDTVLNFNCDDWSDDCGGFISYVAKEEVDELLRIERESNSLALVYTDETTTSFVKYINDRIKTKSNGGVFHDICTTFYEQKE